MTPAERIAQDILDEYRRAQRLFPNFNSPHEAWAVIWEEVDELWQHVRSHHAQRDNAAMLKEALQVGAMAMRFILDIGGANYRPSAENNQ